MAAAIAGGVVGLAGISVTWYQFVKGAAAQEARARRDDRRRAYTAFNASLDKRFAAVTAAQMLGQDQGEEIANLGIPIACEACTFDFYRVYGSHGLDYIECHHRTPLHVAGETRTKLADLALLCSNCHRMIHRSRQWLTVEQLKTVVLAQRPW